MRILVTGATGYIGGRLVPYLLDRGHEVVCLARTPESLAGRPWRGQVEVVRGDVLEPGSLREAFDGIDAAYYLIHSMAGGGGFAEADRLAAQHFRDAAADAGVRRIVYLGGLGAADDDALSKHLASRQEVGRVLASGPVPVTELRAAVIIGSGSVSFEMLRYLTEVLPIMVTPRWVRTNCQPIAIRNVLEYLAAVLEEASSDHFVYEIGGPDVVTYEEMMRTYARVAGLRRRIIVPVPVLSPGLSSRWIGLVTPLPTAVARPLVDSLENEVVVHDHRIEERHPVARLIPLDEAISLALERQASLQMPTRWSDATTSPARPFTYDPEWAGGTIFIDRKRKPTTASPEDLFWAFSRVGGDNGYYGFDWAWRIRGALDTLVGGIGLRRGRRHPEELRVHDSVDFWRVTEVVPGRSLQLEAEMKVPGEAWLEWRIAQTPGETILHQTAYFVPRGLLGRLYWFALLPFHGPIFGRMITNIVATAEARTEVRRVESGAG